MLALSTVTTVTNVHRGVVLPAARVVVLLVPAAALLLYFWINRQKK